MQALFWCGTGPDFGFSLGNGGVSSLSFLFRSSFPLPMPSQTKVSANERTRSQRTLVVLLWMLFVVDGITRAIIAFLVPG